MLKLKPLSLIKNKQSLPPAGGNFLLLAVLLAIFLMVHRLPAAHASSTDPTKYWDIRSVDTMKYSRDMAAAKLNDDSFDTEIQTQVQSIKETGANFVAIDTPYDGQFLPYLKRWVAAARANNLHIWFRGNFSAWEGWFGYKKGMSNSDHTKMAVQFIENNPDLFEDGDIFSSCPECENGAFGDPRQTGKISEYRQFIISETAATSQAFKGIHKQVATNYWSMNIDVAKVIMDKETTQNLGGIVVIDHYVKDPTKLVSDAQTLAINTGGKIFIGEFGAPIPDINGPMTDRQQADFLEQALNLSSKSNSIIGMNYWVDKGGSTAIWDDNNNPRPAVETLTGYFNPAITVGYVQDEFGNPVNDVQVSTADKTAGTQNGDFQIVNDSSQITIKKDGFDDVTLSAPAPATSPATLQITLIKKDKNLIDQLKLWLWRNVKITFP